MSKWLLIKLRNIGKYQNFGSRLSFIFLNSKSLKWQNCWPFNHVFSGSIQTVTTDRLQGQDVDISASSGAILVRDVYARKSSFRSADGDVQLGNLHGDVTVSCNEGNVKIGMGGLFWVCEVSYPSLRLTTKIGSWLKWATAVFQQCMPQIKGSMQPIFSQSHFFGMFQLFLNVLNLSKLFETIFWVCGIE